LGIGSSLWPHEKYSQADFFGRENIPRMIALRSAAGVALGFN
jgi:hypothetical protein